MSEPGFIERLQNEIQHTPGDIRAEVQLLLALEKGLGKENFLTSCTSPFRREYRHDVAGADIREDAARQSLLEVFLSRGGIYDQLPEGLFFRGNQKRTATVGELAEEYRTNRKRDVEIRKFFQPFDHDFFLQRLGIEREENLLLGGLQSGILNEYFIQFWSLPASVPRQWLVPLILLLPYSYKITGDPELTGQGLQQILNEPVKITRSYKTIHMASGITIPALGEGILGLDTVCGNSFREDIPVFEIQIGPLRQSQVTEYLESGQRYKLLETFNRFFIPAGVETVVDILVAPEKRTMAIKKNAGPVLGYSSYL